MRDQADNSDARPHVCTVVARNYLPAARVLAESFLANDPEGTVTVLVLDDLQKELNVSCEPFEIIHLDDLGEDLDELHRMAAIYDVTEFATATKAWLLECLLDRGWPSVLYLDPDIRVFDSLDELDRLAEKSSIILTPHALAPFPRDGKMSDETAILAAGVYNLGFIGVGQGARPFLHYWKERLRRECLVDPTKMRFVDQRWVDFVPSMFDSEIVRDPRWNVAYWNLHERELTWTGDHYEVNGEPLGFYHFSGYSPRAPHVVSKHQGEKPRFFLSEYPALAKIVGEYDAALTSAQFGDESGDGAGEYGLGRALNGIPIDKMVREVYLKRLLASDRGDQDYPPDPFDEKGAEEFLEWLNGIVESEYGPSHLSLYQATLYAFTPELHDEFPDPQTANFEDFQDFLRSEVAAGRIHAALVPDRVYDAVVKRKEDPRGPIRANGSGALWATRRNLIPGMNVGGYLRAELGIGEAARLAVAAVDEAKIPFQTVLYEKTASRQKHPFEVQGSTPERHYDYDTNLVVVNADQFEDFAEQVGPNFFDGHYTIAQWAWELELFPDIYNDAFEFVNEIWAVSEFTRKAIAQATDKPVLAVPHPVVAPTPPPDFDRRPLGLPADKFMFLFCFDLFSVIDRKNPLGLINAFRMAFEPDAGPVLVLKVSNGDKRQLDVEQMRIAAGSRKDIILLDKYLTSGDLAGLMDTADCYVSLHRSEGFGLTMAESMALGKPVIATGYSGNLDFMTPDNSFLVPYTMTEVPSGAEPYMPGSQWADPDLDVASSLMRSVVEDPILASSIASRGRDDVLRHHNLAARAAWVRRRYEATRGLRAVRRPEGLRERATSEPLTLAADVLRSPRSSAKRAGSILKRKAGRGRG